MIDAVSNYRGVDTFTTDVSLSVKSNKPVSLANW